MKEFYSKEYLRMLRNGVPIAGLLSDILDIPTKASDGYLRFLCPKCSEFNTATNPKTNLARCFRCETNYNPIDIVMIVRNLNFKDAVEFLSGLHKT